MNITVHIGALAEKYPLADLHKFLPGHTYKMLELIKEIRFKRNRSQGKSRGNTK